MSEEMRVRTLLQIIYFILYSIHTNFNLLPMKIKKILFSIFFIFYEIRLYDVFHATAYFYSSLKQKKNLAILYKKIYFRKK